MIYEVQEATSRNIRRADGVWTDNGYAVWG
jgi:hypothetical protein